MDAVVLAGKDDVAVLEEHHPARQAEVCVRPFVNLVGEGHKDGQCKQVAVQGVDMVNLRCKKREHTQDDRIIFVLFLCVDIQTYRYRTEDVFLCRRKCQAQFVHRKLTRGEGEEVEGHVC